MKKKEEDAPPDLFDLLYKFGLSIFCDDSPDFPELISHWGKEPGKHGVLKGTTMPNLPPHPHHWTLGAVIMGGAAIGKIIYALNTSQLAQETLGEKTQGEHNGE